MTAPVELAPPAKQGHRSPCPPATAESHGQRDHGDQPLRRNSEDDDLWNSHELHNRGIHLLVHELGNLDGPTNSLDHGKPKRQDRDEDDMEEPTHPLHTRDLDHLKHVQLGISMVRRTVWTM